MGRTIDITVVAARPTIEIDGNRVAAALALDVDTFRRHLDNAVITQLCERGVGEDAGLFRVTFYHEGRRARFVVDATGKPVDTEPCHTGHATSP